MTTLTREEMGALLETVGQSMRAYGLNFGAALDGCDNDLPGRLAARLELPWSEALARAEAILAVDPDDLLQQLGELE